MKGMGIKMRILLTGGTGYIGQYMGKLLVENGHEVIITSRKPEAVVMGYENRQMDLLDLPTITGICKNTDVVIHMANLDELLVKEHPQEALLANSYATRVLYLDAVENGVKHFIYLSTFHVYGANQGDIDENTEVQPKSDYALTHLFAEEYLRQLSKMETCKVSVVRLTNGIGLPLEKVQKWYLVLNDFCFLVYYENRIVMKSNGLPIRDFVAIRDVARALLCLINNAKSQTESFDVYNISSQKTYSMRDIADLVRHAYEKRCHKKIIFKLPDVTEEQLKAVEPLMVHSGKLRGLGWRPELEVTDVIEEIFDGLEHGMYEKRL